MLNRRKALIGYTVYTVGKPVAKLVIKKRAPGKREGLVAAGVAGVAATAGGLMFWLKRNKGEEPASPPEG
jgi:hypothetical protein